MKRILFAFCAIATANLSLIAQSDFQRLYRSSANSQAFANGMQLTSDGGYIMIGRDSANTAQDYDMYLVKLAPNGDTLWARSYGTSGPEYGQYAIQSNDGGYMLVGMSLNTTLDLFLVRTDANGDTLWTRVLGDVGDDEANFVQQANDGNFIVGGYTSSSGAGSYDFFMLKIAGNGNILWSKTYGTVLDELAYSVFQTNDKGYILAGAAMTPGGTIDAYAVKTDSMGVEVWSKYYGTPDTDWGYMMRPTSDGGLVLTGYVGTPSGGLDAWLLKTDALGDTLWSRTFGGSDFEQGLCVVETNNGGYAISGSVYDGSLGGSDAMLLKTDNMGNMTYCNGFGGTGDDWAPSVVQLPDHSFALGAYTNSLNGILYDFYLVRTDTSGNTVGSCNESFTTVQQTAAAFTVTTLTTTVLPFTFNAVQHTAAIGSLVTQVEGCSSLGVTRSSLPLNSSSLLVYPNPSAGTFSINMNQVSSSTVTLTVHDLSGKQVYSETLLNTTGSIQRSFGLKDIAPGSYVVRLTAGGETSSAKMVIVK